LPRWQLNRTFAVIAAASVVVLGGAALAGWLLSVEALKSIVPGSTPMKPSIAAGMLLCGAGLALLSCQKVARPIGICTAVIVATVIGLGAATLGEHFFGWNLGIDQWGSDNVSGAVGTSHSERMSPATALCFLLAGSALFAALQSIPMRIKVPLVAGLSAGLVAIGGLPLVGFFLEKLFGPSWNLMGMTVSGVTGAVGFLLLGNGLLALLKSKGDLRWSLDAFTTAGFALGILLMVFAAAVVFDFAKRMLETTNWVIHRQEVLKETQQVMTGMAELASSERVYTIAGDERLLQDRQSTKAAVQQSLLNVRKLTADNPNQKHSLDRLEPLIAQRIDWEEQVIGACRKQGLSVARQMIATGPGLGLSDEIFGLLKEMENEEYRLLGTDQKQAEAASVATFLLLPMGVFLSLAILSLGVFFLNAGIGERAQAEKSLRESETQLQTIVENLDEGVVVSDLDGQLLQWNCVALKLHGYSGSEQDRRLFSELVDTFELSTLEGLTVPVEQWPLARILRGEHLHDLELRVRRFGTDCQRVFNYGGTLVHDASGSPLMAIVTIGDITERKRAEEEIRKLNTELEHRVAARTTELESANQELEAFSYSVSHDLRAPLRAVDGFSHAVLEDYGHQLPEEGRHYLQTIREGAQRMGVLIDDLLTFSRLSRLPLHKQAVSMTKLAREALEESNGQRARRQIDVRIGEMPSCEGDPALLKQVWVNLLSNAVKYTGKREAAVVDVGSRKEKGENVYFVSDNGTGFDMQYAHKLFGVFQRLHRADEFEGTGVGLAIVQRVIHRHGGRVWANAGIDQGASFCFTLGKETNT
jgi:PAS domain S-box-containing protein